jgi:hypothetical protein
MRKELTGRQRSWAIVADKCPKGLTDSLTRGSVLKFMSVPEETLKAAVLLLGAVVGLSCGPIQSTAVLLDTENMLEAAHTSQAERLAPYEWTAASLYFAKAKEEVGSSEYEAAVGYGKKALDFATKARDVALKNARRSDPGERPSVMPR